MKIGLFFGSYNPIHIGHLVIAEYIANYTDLDKVWLVVSPQNPLKSKKGLSNTYDRLEMVRLAIEDSNQLAVCDIELKLPQPSYTIDTLTYLSERYPEHEWTLIMGADNLASIHKWKNFELLLENYHIIAYPRPGIDAGTYAYHPHVQLVDAPLMELSASFIREAIHHKKSVHYMLPARVWEFIESKGLYRH